MVMAQINVLSGAYDDAIDELETLLELQSWWTTSYMKADPILAPLRDLPRFKAMIKKYERKHGL
jgi:hypothetical protein